MIESLIQIKDEGAAHNLKAEDVALAVGLLTTTVKLKFIFLMELLSKLFAILEPANEILQRRDIGYRQAAPVIQSVKTSIFHRQYVKFQRLSGKSAKMDHLPHNEKLLFTRLDKRLCCWLGHKKGGEINYLPSSLMVQYCNELDVKSTNSDDATLDLCAGVVPSLFKQKGVNAIGHTHSVKSSGSTLIANIQKKKRKIEK